MVINLIKEKMYVRCPVDSSVPTDPRDFALARVVNIDELSETAELAFFDSYGIRQYYQMPLEYTCPISRLRHAKVHHNAVVVYSGMRYTVRAFVKNKEDGYYYYYLTAVKNDSMVKVCETEIEASFNDGEIDPCVQLLNYEFQHPMWFFGRRNVSQTMETLENSIYGFKELSGCKIFLKPYQLKTVMRCLKQEHCRDMIADEVGLGKTIEAAAVLKIFMTDHRNAKILIVVPDALAAQWKTELAFKFNIFEQADENGNTCRILPLSNLHAINLLNPYNFVIVDEVHQCLRSDVLYAQIMELSRHAENVLMLSATPVQDRKNEYYRLLKLIQPEKYERITETAFEEMLTQQNRIIRNVHEAMGSLEDYIVEIEDAENELSEDALDAYEELEEYLENIEDIVSDKVYSEMIGRIETNSSDFGVSQIQTALAYICETYQLEKCIIRNRRSVLGQDARNQRMLVTLPYDIAASYNNTQLQVYRLLSDWLEEQHMEVSDFERVAKPLVSSFFSSASAFAKQLSHAAQHMGQLPEEMNELTLRWLQEEQRECKEISNVMQDPYEAPSRMVQIFDYMDQEAYDKKVLLFTGFSETFRIYHKALQDVFGDSCCFFQRGMSEDELELNTYRFQTNPDCRIMLSDESGGEGRNFQNADVLIHIDLPWNVNTLEQRIGRLDRIGRTGNRPVVSVVSYAADTLEADLFKVWHDGLHIFEESQSGLEIIMNEIDEKITASTCQDLKYGLTNMLPEMMADVAKLQQIVKTEQHFDVAAYQYQAMNQQLDRSVKLYNEKETDLFASSMLGWASMTGFKGMWAGEDTVRFDESSFSIGSALNTWFIPPNMKAVIEQQLNQMQNHIRKLNHEKDVAVHHNYIQGTFRREKALANDYLHFFAPGDPVFDSIVQNAVHAYRGRCAAIAMPAEFDWTGFVFTWRICPDEANLLEHGIDLRKINQYRGFLPAQQVTNAVSINQNTAVSEAQVLSAFQEICALSGSDVRKHVDHLGKRHGKSNGLLNIKDRYGCTNMEWFRHTFPIAKWKNYVRESASAAQKNAVEKLRTKFNLKGLKEELLQEISAQKAAQMYYGQEDLSAELERINTIILDTFRHSSVELDSVCFVRMVKCG